MRQHRRTMITWAVVGTLICSVFLGACTPANWFGSNLNVTFVLPMGLGGTPGLLNPFGIVQALVNSLLGLSSSGTAGGSTYPTPDTSSPSYLNPAIAAVVD